MRFQWGDKVRLVGIDDPEDADWLDRVGVVEEVGPIPGTVRPERMYDYEINFGEPGSVYLVYEWQLRGEQA